MDIEEKFHDLIQQSINEGEVEFNNIFNKYVDKLVYQDDDSIEITKKIIYMYLYCQSNYELDCDFNDISKQVDDLYYNEYFKYSYKAFNDEYLNSTFNTLKDSLNEKICKNVNQFVSLLVKEYYPEDDFEKEPLFTHERFGDFYSDLEDVVSNNYKVTFNKYHPEIVIQYYESKNDNIYFEALDYVVNNFDNIVEGLYNEVLSTCDDWCEKDEDDNEVTLDFIKEHYIIHAIYINDSFIEVWGYLENTDVLGGHSINAVIDVKTKKLHYNLEG